MPELYFQLQWFVYSNGHRSNEGIKSNTDSAILTLKTAVTLISSYMALMQLDIKVAASF